MREMRLSGSEGGVALTPPSLPLSPPNPIVFPAFMDWTVRQKPPRHPELNNRVFLPILPPHD